MEIDDFQQRTATSTDASLRRVHSDMQHLSGGLLDILNSVQRLEDKLDRLASGDGEWRMSSPQKSPSAASSASRGRFPPANRSRSRGNASESSAEVLEMVQVASVGEETVNRKKAMSNNRALQGCQAILVPTLGNQAEVYTRAARAPVRGNRIPAQCKTPAVENVAGQPKSKAVDSAQKTDMPMEVIIPVRKQATKVLDSSAGIKPSDSLEQAVHPSLDTKIGEVNRMLERIAVAVGVKVGGNEGDDEEDRKRLKEKLKTAIELDRRARVHTIVSSREMWLEYIFGICSPDKRVGKRGSRY